MTLATLKIARSGVQAINIPIGLGLVIYVLVNLGFTRALGFLLVWFIFQAAWGSFTNVLETVATGIISRKRMEELDAETIASNLPVGAGPRLPFGLGTAMFLFVIGTIAMPWVAAWILFALNQ